MEKRKIQKTHAGDKRSPHREAVNQFLHQRDFPGNSMPDDKRIKTATVPHKGSRQPWGPRDGR